MNQADLEYLKASIDQRVLIETRSGERLTVKVISVFEDESEPDVFFEVEGQPGRDVGPGSAYSLPLAEIDAVRPLSAPD